MSRQKVLFYAGLVLALLVFAVGGAAALARAGSASGMCANGPCSPSVAALPVAQAADTGPARTISVVGTGTASGSPDVAEVTLGVETQASSAQQAVADNQTKMTALLATLKGLGIADADIRTTNYSLFIERPPAAPGAQVQPGAEAVTYRVTNQVLVKVRDVSQLGAVLDKAVAAGANSVYGVSFGVSDPTKLQDEARAGAVADAKARATSLAQLAGVTLGPVQSLSESGARPGPISAAPMAALSIATPIQPGELEVAASVQVTYAIQ